MAITNKTDNDWLNDVQLETDKPTVVLFGSLADIGETPTVPQERTAEAYDDFEIAEEIVNSDNEVVKFFYADSDVAATAANISSIGSQPTSVLYKRGIEINRVYGGDVIQGISDLVFPELSKTLAFNGEVCAIAPDGGGGWYVGGDFTQVTDTADMQGCLAQRTIGPTSIADGAGFFVDGVVHVIIRDPINNGFIIGGEFTTVNKTPRRNLARFNSSFVLQDWNPGTDGPVYALAFYGVSDVVVGGNFNVLGGSGRSRLGSVPRTSDAATSWSPGANGTVRALATVSTDILVGGDFTILGGEARNHIGSVPGNSDTATSWNPDVDGSVKTIVRFSTNEVFFGGTFFNVGLDARDNIASTGAYPSDTATFWDPNPNGPIYSLNVAWDGASSYYLMVGGDFSTFDSLTLGNVAKVDLSTMTTDGTWNPDTDGPVYSIYSYQPHVLVGGDFQTAKGGTEARKNYLISTLSDDTPFACAPSFELNDKVRAAYLHDSTFAILGGEFCGTEWQARQRLAHIIPAASPNYFELDPAWTPTADNKVLALEVYGTTVVVGGSFLNLNGTSRQYLGAVDNTGTLIYSSMDCDDVVTVMKKQGTVLFVGGNFSNIEGNSIARLAKFYLADLSLGPETLWNPGCDAPPFAMDFVETGDVMDPVHLVVGGTFTTLAGSPRNNLGSVTIANGLSITAEGWDPDPNDRVSALAVDGGTVYVGGDFTTLNGEARSYLGAFTYGNDVPLESWKPSANGPIKTMLTNKREVFFGGEFSTVSTTPRKYIASTPMLAGTLSSWNPGVNSYVKSISTAGAYVAFGGIFTGADSSEAETITAPICRFFTIAKMT